MEATGLEVRDAAAQDQGAGSPASPSRARPASSPPISGWRRSRSPPTTGACARADRVFRVRSSRRWRASKNSDKPLKDVDPVDFRALLPTVGTMRFSGARFRPEEQAGGPGAEQGAEARKHPLHRQGRRGHGGEARQRHPDRLSRGDEQHRLRGAAGASQNDLKDLAALGCKAADLSFMTAGSWNEAGSELVVREVSLSGVDMGRATLRGVLGNVGKEVFNPDSAISSIGPGRHDRQSPRPHGREQGPVRAGHRHDGEAAEEILGRPAPRVRHGGRGRDPCHPRQFAIREDSWAGGRALRRQAGRLTISAKTKDAAGLGIADFAALGEPAAILDKIEVATAAE